MPEASAKKVAGILANPEDYLIFGLCVRIGPGGMPPEIRRVRLLGR